MATEHQYTRDEAGLEACRPPEVVELADGAAYTLRIAPVAKRIEASTVRMLAYNGSVPGPILKVPQGAEIDITVENHGDLEATVHWHGIRLDNRADGTHETQEPVPVGGSFSCRVAFPDTGIYWYHPHIREDYAQELGLYGSVIVEPEDPAYWPPANRELALTLDDVLIEDGKIAPFSPHETTFSAMGRYGNVLLVNGEPHLDLTARRGEILRLYMTNTANARVFRVQLPGARMKLVGGDSGRCEREEFVADVTISPSERAVVDVLFDTPGRFTLEHRTPDRVYDLAAVDVEETDAEPSYGREFHHLRHDRELSAERAGLEAAVSKAPDKTLALVAEMATHEPSGEAAGAEAPAPHHADHAGGLSHGTDGIEWEDEMLEVNRRTTPSNTAWKIVDRGTGAANREIRWRFRVGDRVKWRIVNEMESDHPMHHPFHVHGAGRFLVLARDGNVEPNLIWKDTVLITTGETVDILLELTNPGRWMAHCHIAEHHETGMAFSFDVDP